MLRAARRRRAPGVVVRPRDRGHLPAVAGGQHPPLRRLPQRRRAGIAGRVPRHAARAATSIAPATAAATSGRRWPSTCARGQLYTVSSNCDIDDDPSTPPPPVTPPFEEAIFALTLDGDLAWSWRPREVDPDDLDFGAVPNLFEAEIGGAVRDVVGVGGKDGTYYVLDRDGTNEITDAIEPYWRPTSCPAARSAASSAPRRSARASRVFSTGFGFSIARPQKPAVHALDLTRRQHPLGELGRRHRLRARAAACRAWRCCGGTPRPEAQHLRARRRHAAQVRCRRRACPSGVASAADHGRRPDVRRRRHRRFQRGLRSRRGGDARHADVGLLRPGHARVPRQHLRRRQHLHLRLPRPAGELRQPSPAPRVWTAGPVGSSDTAPQGCARVE